MAHKHSNESTPRQKTYGVLAEFDNVSSLMAAAKVVRDAGYTKWDAHTPFPVHGLDDAMGVKPTKLPWVIFGAGLTGLSFALGLQWWTNAHDYQFLISGKPMFSLPANVPVIFELTVLFSAFTAFFGCLAFNKLPELFHPLFGSARFRKATDDRFFISVEAADPQFDVVKTSGMLKSLHSTNVETVMVDDSPEAARIPKGIVLGTAVLASLTLIPLALIARAREVTTTKPRVHIIPDDMDQQYKFKAQTAYSFFADGRASRVPPEGTVAVEDLEPGTPFQTGKQGETFLAQLPPEVVMSDALMARGQERYDVYCAPCHGLSGYGDGLVAKRADRLREGTWVPPSSLHSDNVRAQAIGQLFNSISFGVRNMPAYGPLIPEQDRWAIVTYVKALQLSQYAPKDAVPAEDLPALQ